MGVEVIGGSVMNLDDPKAAARALSRRIVCRYWLLAAAWVLCVSGVVAFGVAAWQLTSNRGNLIVLPFVLVGLGWAAWLMVRARATEPRVFPLEPDETPLLASACRELADELGVPGVDRIALTSAPAVWVSHGDDGLSTVVVGTPLLWHLSLQELRSVLAPPIASSVLGKQPQVQRARRLAERVLLTYGSTPAAVGWILRRVAATFDEALQSMEREIRTCGQLRAVACGIDPPSPEQDIVGEAWDILLDRFVAPASRRELRISRLHEGLRAVLAEFDRNRLIDREWQRPRESPPATDLLECPSELDHRMTRWLYAQVAAEAEEIDWEHFPERVVRVEQRELAGDLVRAVSTMAGEPVPARTDAVLDAVDEVAIALGALLAGGTSVSGSPPIYEGAAREVLQMHLEAFICTALVDAGLARRKLDWLGLAPLLDQHDGLISISQDIQAAVLSGDSAALRTRLSSVGLSLDDLVFVGGVDAPAPARFATPLMQPVMCPSLGTLCLHNDRLLVISTATRSAGRKFLDGLAFRAAHADDLAAHLTTPVQTLTETGAVKHSLPLADIVDVRLTGRRWSMTGWRCVIKTAQHRVVLRGPRPAALAAAEFTALLGDRVSVQRIRRDPATGAWQSLDISVGRIMAAKVLLGVGALVLFLPGLAALLTVATPAHAGSALACHTRLEGDEYQRYETTCDVTVPRAGTTDVVSVDTREAVAPGTPLNIHFADWTGLEPWEEEHTWDFVRVLGIIGAVFAIPGLFLAVPWRRQLLSY